VSSQQGGGFSEPVAQPTFGSCQKNQFTSFTMAPPKPSTQTQFILEAMSKTNDDEKNRWDHVMDQFDMLFSRVNDISLIQQELKTDLKTHSNSLPSKFRQMDKW
jgi:hypothetical protein